VFQLKALVRFQLKPLVDLKRTQEALKCTHRALKCTQGALKHIRALKCTQVPKCTLQVLKVTHQALRVILDLRAIPQALRVIRQDLRVVILDLVMVNLMEPLMVKAVILNTKQAVGLVKVRPVARVKAVAKTKVKAGLDLT